LAGIITASEGIKPTEDPMDYFADLDEPDLSVHTRPAAPLVRANAMTQAEVHAAYTGETYVENCQKCRGSGIYYGRSRHGQKCFTCKGVGRFTFRTSPEQRAKARAQAHASKVRKVEAAVAGFAESHPEAAAWIAAKRGGFGFAQAMHEAVERYGHLTDKQMATVERLRAADAERDAARAKARAEREANAPVMDLSRVAAAFQSAFDKGAKRVSLRLAGFKFKPAKATGANPGAIYVTQGETYLGKVQDGRFKRSFECTEVLEQEIVGLAADPETAAIAYGRQFGVCAICNRDLTDPESVQRGIGPVCAEKFGW
jgi:hypothetical protein